MELESRDIRKMSYGEARDILINAYNDGLLCVCGGLFDNDRIYDCIQSLCMALMALDELKDNYVE